MRRIASKPAIATNPCETASPLLTTNQTTPQSTVRERLPSWAVGGTFDYNGKQRFPMAIPFRWGRLAARKNAQRKVRELGNRGFDNSYIQVMRSNGKVLYKVVVGRIVLKPKPVSYRINSPKPDSTASCPNTFVNEQSYLVLGLRHFGHLDGCYFGYFYWRHPGRISEKRSGFNCCTSRPLTPLICPNLSDATGYDADDRGPRSRTALPDRQAQGNLVLLPGWNFSRTSWCENSSVCDKALAKGFALVLPEMGQSIYADQYYPETQDFFKQYPLRGWLQKDVTRKLQTDFGLLEPGGQLRDGPEHRWSWCSHASAGRPGYLHGSS